MQIEGMAELTPPLLDAQLGELPPMDASPLATSNSTSIYTTLTDVTRGDSPVLVFTH
jgi:hypothetical protein